MDFNHDYGSVAGLLTIDTTVQPDQGGTPNILEVQGTGGIRLPAGGTGTRILGNGIVRFNTDTYLVEYCANGAWYELSGGAAAQQMVHISNTQPVVAPGNSYMWIQTNIGINNDMTFWIEDGVI